MRVRTYIMRVRTPVFPLLLSGCLSSGPEAIREPIDPPTSIIASSTTVDVNLNPDREVVTEAIVATPEAAWAALQSAYEDLKIPVGELNHERMILGNPKFILSRNLNRNRLSTYLDCGQGPSGNYADLHRIEMQVRSSIIPVEGGVQVNTFVAAVARNMEGTSNNRIRCASKFRLEQEIAGRVRFYAEGR